MLESDTALEDAEDSMRRIRLREKLDNPAVRAAYKDKLRDLYWSTGEFDTMKDVDHFLADEALRQNPTQRPRR